MNKKKFIILIAVIAVLAGVLYFLNNTQPEPQLVITQERQMDPILILDSDKIVRFEVKTEGEEYVIFKTGDEWVGEGKDNTTLLSTRIDMLIEKTSNIVPDELVAENPQDLEQYGLKDPIRITKVILDDGESYTIKVGNLTYDENQRYVMIEGNPNVYLFPYSALNDYAPMFDNLRNMDIFSVYSTEYIDRLTVYDRDKDITYEFAHQSRLTDEEKAMDFVEDNTINEWKMTKPFVATCLDEKFVEGVINKFTAIWADDYIDDNPVGYDKYGLSDPQFVITIKTTLGETKSLYVGNTVDKTGIIDANNKVYVRSDDKKNVYAIYKDYVSFLYVDMFTNLSSIPVINSIGSVRGINITSGEKTYSFDIAADKYRLNGKELTTDEYKRVYATIIGFTAHGICNGNENITGKKMADIKITLTDGSVKSFEIVEFDDRNAVIVINNKPNFFVLNKQVNKMLETMSELSE